MARKRLFDRLPSVWKRLDLIYGPDGKPTPGFVERFLSVLDTGFDRSHAKAKELLSIRSVDGLPDRYLALLPGLVGQRWRSGKSHDWHRRKTASAIKRWSYRGTDVCLGDLIEEHGGGPWEVVDMASRYEVWSRQGEYGAANNNFFDADMFHPGVFVLTISDQVDFNAFLEDFEEIRPSGTRWYFKILSERNVVFDLVWNQERYVDQGSTNEPTRIYSEGFWDYQPQPQNERIVIPVAWSGSRNVPSRIFGEEFLDYEGQPSAEREITPVVWFGSLTRRTPIFGEEFLDYEPQPGCGIEIEDGKCTACPGGYLTVTSPLPITLEGITVSMGSIGNPLPADLAGMQAPAERFEV